MTYDNNELSAANAPYVWEDFAAARFKKHYLFRKIGFGTLFAIMAIFAVLDLAAARKFELLDLHFVFYCRVICLAVIAVTFGIMRNWPEKAVGRWIVPTCVLIISLVTVAADVTVNVHHLLVGRPYTVDGAILLLLLAYFPLGYAYWVSGVIGILIVTTFGWATLQFNSPADQHYFWALLPNVIAAFAAIAALRYAQEITEHKSIALKNRLRQLADTDPLTGLFNRRAFEKLANRGLLQSRRDQQQCSMLMLDVDHFKLYNDFYGHPAGDAALKAVAATIATASRRPLDVAGRLGGEEFAVCLPSTSLIEAQHIGQSICDDLSGQRIAHEKSKTFPFLTVSVGVASTMDGEDYANIFRNADLALYAAKERGKNRVEAYRSPT